MSIVTTRDETAVVAPVSPLVPRATLTRTPQVTPPHAVTGRRSRVARFLTALALSGTPDRRGFAAQDRGAYQEYLARVQRRAPRR